MRRLLVRVMPFVLVIGTVGLVSVQALAAPQTPDTLMVLEVPSLTPPPPPETLGGWQPPLRALPAVPRAPASPGGLLYLTSLDVPETTFAVYDPVADSWTTLNPYETGCQMAVSRLNQLYAYGNSTSTIDRYDPATDTWTPVFPAPPGSTGAYCNLEITHAGEFLYTEYGSATLWYTAGLIWNTLPLPFLANAMGDYDPVSDQYVIGQRMSANAHAIDVHTWAITDYSSPLDNYEYARFGVVMANRYYVEAGGSNLHSFDLGSPALPPLDHGVSPGWYTSAAADRVHRVIYSATLNSMALNLFDPRTDSLTPLTGYSTSTWHSSLAFVPPPWSIYLPVVMLQSP
jgi:hypothetical protein